jgi:hypothetical protein
MVPMLAECLVIFIVSFRGTLKTVFQLFTNVIGLNMANGLRKVLKYHASGKEIFISYTETQITVKEY